MMYLFPVHTKLDPHVFLSSGVCLIKSESGGNTAAKGGPNPNGSYDYGLFQVSTSRNSSFEEGDREFECSSENSCISTFLYVVITVQHINETENVSLLTDTVQGNLQKRITIRIIFVTPTVLILINVEF